MSVQHIGHGEIARFAEDRVNLRQQDAAEMRAQAGRLREKLEAYIADHPDFELRKMLLSGSLAKGTALKSTSDIDVACYISSAPAPRAVAELIAWLAKRLETAFPNIKASQIKRKEYSVSITFVGTGNEIDIVPILYDEDPQWRGNLISQETGEPLMTSIPLHLDFFRKRKAANETHYAQVIRLLKYWAAQRKQADPEFRFKSFMTELVVAHLADAGTKLSDYPEALASAFNFIAADGLRSTIAFRDYYDPRSCKVTAHPIRIWDPVNCENNVAKLYTDAQRLKVVDAALQAGDAVDAALRAVSKSETVRYWQKVFGPTFSA